MLILFRNKWRTVRVETAPQTNMQFSWTHKYTILLLYILYFNNTPHWNKLINLNGKTNAPRSLLFPDVLKCLLEELWGEVRGFLRVGMGLKKKWFLMFEIVFFGREFLVMKMLPLITGMLFLLVLKLFLLVGSEAERVLLTGVVRGEDFLDLRWCFSGWMWVMLERWCCVGNNKISFFNMKQNLKIIFFQIMKF